MIRQLLYRSGQLYEFTAQDMIRLLLQSREHNGRRGISGMLLMRDGLFMQLLEGPAAAVEDLFERISADPRHVGVEMLARVDRAAPLLGRWRMGWAEAPLGEDEGPTFAGLDSDVRALEVLEQAGADPAAASLRAFLRGEPPGDAGAAPTP